MRGPYSHMKHLSPHKLPSNSHHYVINIPVVFLGSTLCLAFTFRKASPLFYSWQVINPHVIFIEVSCGCWLSYLLSDKKADYIELPHTTRIDEELWICDVETCYTRQNIWVKCLGSKLQKRTQYIMYLRGVGYNGSPRFSFTLIFGNRQNVFRNIVKWLPVSFSTIWDFPFLRLVVGQGSIAMLNLLFILSLLGEKTDSGFS